MKILHLVFYSIFFIFSLQAQPKLNGRKYPSLLWEITGNGLKKPSYLIGTMHVSSKLAFNLPDSFYLAIRSAQVVALESNPETWQEDMSKYDLNEYDAPDNSLFGNFYAIPSDYLGIKTLKFFKYDKKIERALYSNPTTINNLLYRSYGNENSDFEEDTYLDMYIFQCGKKWNKKVTGVENYGESMKLMAEAYRDAAKDKNIRRRSYNDADNDYSEDKLEEAYRTGNLDLLDSINKYNSVSAAFDEKFLYKRNEIQANSIDSIIKSGTSLFVGVGAAHLPGDRGVIEMLRSKGYKLRPIKMGERASREKELVDRIRVPVAFHTETAPDGGFKVDIPGKFYQFGDDPTLDQRQYADMSNGSYYMVTRVMTNSWMWGHNTDAVYRTIDSLLYENIPGKIISKTAVTRNGYKGIDITNRTRRGDVQRYNIFITPFEVLIFKMSGNSDYVRTGTEASKFFGSIQLKAFKNENGTPVSWKKFSPSFGGFSVNMPHTPFMGNDGSWIFDAADEHAGEHFRVIRTDIHNYHFVEEDSFDLGLMDESFSASEFIGKQLFRKQGSVSGYPSLDAKFEDKNGKLLFVRYIIAGPHYYTLIAQGKKESTAINEFLKSFQVQPFQYGEAKVQKDSTLYFTVRTPVYPAESKIKLGIPYYIYEDAGKDDPESESDKLEAGAFRNKSITSDSTGEQVYVSFYRFPRYYYSKDSSSLEKDNERSVFGNDSSWIVRKNKSSEQNGMKVWELQLSDSNSSRMLWGKSFYRDGIGFSIATMTDTVTAPSPFLKTFFETFTPADTIKGINPFIKKSAVFFSDYRSTDSSAHQRAVKYIGEVDLDSTDVPDLKSLINTINWNEKRYLDTKTKLINRMGDIPTKASADYLRDLYYALNDTISLQYAVLENLLQHKTSYSFQLFREIIKNEPPVLQTTSDYNDYVNSYMDIGYDNGKFFDELSDSLKLTRTILPDLLTLLNLEDYKTSILSLLGKMVDSNLVTTKDYEAYIDRFILEAKQELKKQLIAEKKKAIEKAEEDKEGNKNPYSDYYDTGKDAGNDDLSLYTTILLPYWDKNPGIPTLITQVLKSGDKRLKYNTMMLLEKNGKNYPDSLVSYFASLDEYRYELYKDLRSLGKLAKFPARYKTHQHLGISALLDKKLYGKPDSVVYLDRLKTTYRSKAGYFYFFKYKEKKDDVSWRLAVAGLIPEDPDQFEIDDSSGKSLPSYLATIYSSYGSSRYGFTDFTTIKFEEDEPLVPQLKNLQKRLLISRRKSGKGFYDEEKDEMPYND